MKADERERPEDAGGLPGDFERELGRQFFVSEKLRAGSLALTAAALFAIIASIAAIQHARGGSFVGWQWGLSVAIFAIIYELIARRAVQYFLDHDRPPPPIGRYVNAFIEGSFPTVVMFGIAKSGSPDVALIGAPHLTYYFFIILSALQLEFRLSAFSGLVAALGYSALVYFFIDELRLVTGANPQAMIAFVLRPVLFLMSGVVAGLVARQIRASVLRSLRATEDRRQVVQMFGQHVSPAVVKQLLAQPTGLSSELRDVCIFVLDIRNFTTFSERASPDDVVAYLNCLWGSAVDIVNRHQGIVNKFLGDGFMAVFGAPLVLGNNSENALNAAREILADVERASAAGEIPPTKVGIGLHAGQALVGNIGSSERREYTVIGDVVNVAFRIEQLNKEFGSTLLISESVRRGAGLGDLMEASTSLPIRGRQAPVQIYKLA
jgi:adenylate cyclase